MCVDDYVHKDSDIYSAQHMCRHSTLTKNAKGILKTDDIIETIKIPLKVNFLSGKTEPSQEKLVVLGMALNVSESWLMGFNVGRARKDTPNQAKEDFNLISKFSLLSERDQKIVLSLIDSMLSN